MDFVKSTEFQVLVSWAVTWVFTHIIKTNIEQKDRIAGVALGIGVVINAVWHALSGQPIGGAFAPGLAAGTMASGGHEVFKSVISLLFKKK